MDYTHRQSTVLPLAFTLAIFLFVTVMMVVADEFLLWALLITIAIAGIVLIFSRLTVRVDHQAVVAFFGYGWPAKRIKLGDIETTEVVRNLWIYGLGIRKIPGGWMYNVWGLDAVELVLDCGKKFRIGTDEPETLRAAIERGRSNCTPAR